MARFYDKFVVRDISPYMAAKNGVRELSEKVAQMKAIRSTPDLDKASTALDCCSEKLMNITVSSASFKP